MKLYKGAVVSSVFAVGVICGNVTKPSPDLEDQATNRKDLTRESSFNLPTQIEKSGVAGKGQYKRKLFSSLSSDNLEMLVHEAERSDEAIENETLLLVLVSEWAKQDPQAALSYAEGVNRSDLIYEALLQFGKSDFNLAKDWFAGREIDPSQSNYYMAAMYRGLTMVDASGAVRQIEELEPGLQRDQLLAMSVNEWAKVDVHAAFDWLELADLNPGFSDIYDNVMYQYINQEPQLASNVILAMSDESKNKAKLASQVAYKLAESDLDKALTWSESLTGESEKSAMRSVLNRWVTFGSEKDALDYLVENPNNPDFKNLLNKVIVKFAEKSPEQLFSLMGSLDEQTQIIAAKKLALIYGKGDVKGFVAWHDQLEDGHVKDEATIVASNQYKNNNIPFAFALAESIGDSIEREIQTQQILVEWFAVDHEKAAQVLENCSVLTSIQKKELLDWANNNMNRSDYVLPEKL